MIKHEDTNGSIASIKEGFVSLWNDVTIEMDEISSLGTPNLVLTEDKVLDDKVFYSFQ